MDTPRTLHGGLHLEAVCPCIVLKDPTEGTCTGVVAWHIHRGSCNGIALDDLTVVVALHTPGNMAEGDWTVALCLDDRASPEQQEALGTIFGGEAGGHPATLAEFIGEVRAVEAVPITFEWDGKRGDIHIGEVGEAEPEPIEGQDGAAPTVENHPLSVAGIRFIGWGILIGVSALF